MRNLGIRATIPFAILGVVVLVAYVATLREGHVWGDSAHYIGHALNLAEGLGYGETGYIFDPAAPEIGPQNYPPVTALMLAPVAAVRGLDFAAFKVVMAFSVAAALLLLALGFRSACGGVRSGLLMVVLASSPLLWEQKDHVTSDAPFLLWCYGTLLACDGLIRSKSAHPGRAVLCGILMGVAFATRGVGIVLPPALLLAEVVQRRGRPRRRVVIALMGFAASFAALKSAMPSGGGYGDRFFFSVEHITANIIAYAKYAAVPFEGAYPAIFSLIPAAVVYGLAAIGLTRLIRHGFTARGSTMREFFAFGYLALIVLWPGNQGVRFLLPVIPIAIGWSFVGCAALQDRFGARMGRLVTGGLCVLLLGTSVSALLTADMAPWQNGVTSSEAQQFFRYVERETPEDAVFLFRKPRVLATYAGRSASGWAEGGSHEVLLARARAIGATHVAAGPFEDDVVRALARAYPRLFWRVWTNEAFSVFRLKSGGGSR